MVLPLAKVDKIKKKSKNAFKRHQCDRKIAVKVRPARRRPRARRRRPAARPPRPR
jgi:hypothetical protein